MHKLGWAAIVEGDPLDVADWEDALKPPFDPWVEKYGTETILRSKIFDGLPTGADVYNRALSYVERLNGVLALSHPKRTGYAKRRVQIRPRGKRIVFCAPEPAGREAEGTPVRRVHLPALTESLSLRRQVRPSDGQLSQKPMTCSTMR